MLSDCSPIPTLATSNLDRSRAFCQGLLGFKPMEEMGDGNEGMRSVWFSDPDGNILNVETHTHTS